MSITNSEQRFELWFSTSKPPELVRTVYVHDRASDEVKLDREGFDWGLGTIAFSIFFLKYLAWSSEFNEEEDFFLRSEQRGKPVTTLANALETDTSLSKFFGKAAQTQTKLTFLPRRGDYRKHQPPHPQTVRVRRRMLPPEAVRIFCGKRRLTQKHDLEEFIALLEEQWRIRNNPSTQGSSAVRPKTGPKAHTQAEAELGSENQGTGRALRVFFQALDEVVSARYEPSASLIPNLASYKANQVHCSMLLPEIKSRLKSEGIALVFGKGATGKTTMAKCIAFDYSEAKRQVFFLDCGRYFDSYFHTQVTTELLDLACRSALIVLDNAHLQPDLAVSLFHRWRASRRSSQLLILSREVGYGFESVGRQIGLSSLVEKSLHLEVQETDLLGILNSVAARADVKNQAKLNPPARVLRRWHKLFAGDLIAFTIAVRERLPNLTDGDWELDPGHVKAWICEHYLRPLDYEEHQALLRLAVLGQYELSVQQSFFPNKSFAHSLQTGLVLKINTSGAHGSEFVLSHAGLGKLLLHASDEAPNEARVCREFMEMFPERADYFLLQQRLFSPAWGELQSTDLETLHLSLQELSLTARDAISLDEHLVCQRERLVSGGLAASFDDLLGFLAFAEASLPRTFSLIESGLLANKHREQLVGRFLCLTSNHQIAAQGDAGLPLSRDELERPRNTRTKCFIDAVVGAALAPKFKEHFVARMWQRGVSYYREFSDYVKEVQGPAKYRTLTSWLSIRSSVHAAEEAFFFSAASGVEAMAEAVRLIQEEMPNEVVSLYKTVFSDDAVQKRLGRRLSIVPKDEPGLKSLWKELTVFIPVKQLNSIRRSVGTKDGEQLLQEYGKPMPTIKKASSS